MTMTVEKSDPVAELLRVAGPRADVPEDRSGRVRAAVQAEWRDMLRQRQARLRAGWAAGCIATAAIVAVIFQVAARPMPDQAALAQPQPRGVRAAAEISTATVATTDVRYVQAQSTYRRDGTRDRGAETGRAPEHGMSRASVVGYSWESR